MSSREQLGQALAESLSEVAALLEHAHTVALEEQEALVANDAEGIALACKAHEEILRRIAETDQRAGAVADQLSELAGLDPDQPGAESISEAAGEPYAGSIRRQIGRIARLAAQVQEAHEINHKLLENGLDIIACCLRTVAQEGEPNGYSNQADIVGPPTSILALDRKA